MSSTYFLRITFQSFFFFFKTQPHSYQAEKKSGANLNSRLVKNRISYRSRLVNWLTLEKKEKPLYQSFSLMVSYQKMYVLSKLKLYWSSQKAISLSCSLS